MIFGDGWGGWCLARRCQDPSAPTHHSSRTLNIPVEIIIRSKGTMGRALASVWPVHATVSGLPRAKVGRLTTNTGFRDSIDPVRKTF